ncbi:MAG: hypothetical protein ABJB76_05135 [Candidatus Nitrosocosmicus sp.]
MNIAQTENPFVIEAKTCGCKNKKNITYSFIESSHSLCIDRREIILAQIQACERLLKFIKDKIELAAIEKEISELKLAQDLTSY